MIIPEFYYTLKYAFQMKENLLDFFPIHPEHKKVRDTRFIEQITEYLNDKNLNLKDIKKIFENNIYSSADVKESNLLKLKKNEKIKAEKNKEFLEIKKIIYQSPNTKFENLIDKYVLKKEKEKQNFKPLKTKTEYLNFKDLSFLKDNSLLFLLRNKDIEVFNQFLKNKQILEADFIWNNFNHDWSIKKINRYMISRIQDEDLLECICSEYKDLSSIKEMNKIISNLTEEDLKDYCSHSYLYLTPVHKKDRLESLRKTLIEWKVGYEKKNLDQILEKPQSIKKAQSRRL